MTADEREIKVARLKAYAHRIDLWVWTNVRRTGLDEATARVMGLEVETVRRVRRMFEKRRAA